MITVSDLVQILIFVFSLSLYVTLVSHILPWLLLKARYRANDLGDRGLKRYIFDGGRAIAYKPCGQSGKYIQQYILFADDGDKYIKCRFDKRVRSVKYDVVALDSKNKEINTVQVSVPILSMGDAAAAMLPEQTSYVCVVVKEVNGFIVPDSPNMHYSFIRVVAFAGITTILTVVEFMILRIAALSVFGSALSIIDLIMLGLPVAQVFASVLVGAVLSLIILVIHRQRDVKIF